MPCTSTTSSGLHYKAVPRLRECWRQVEAEVVSNSRNKSHQTWERPFSGDLYMTSTHAALLRGETEGGRTGTWEWLAVGDDA